MAKPEDYADFRIISKCPSGSKKNSSSYESNGGLTRYRFTLGEVLSWNMDLDVTVGNGWTRITLKEIPRFIHDAFNIIMEKGLNLDGIFRKEGNSVRLNRAEVQDVYRGACQIPTDYTVYDICTMIKRFLRDLKPLLLNSGEFRGKLMNRAREARRSNDYKMDHSDMVNLFEYNQHLPQSSQHLSPAHLGTLAYVMRFLSRISKHAEVHKMTVDNLSVVLVGAVFGDFMGGGTESRKKGLNGRRCSAEQLRAKKEDMEIQVAAVKLLILNSNLIGLPKSHYVSSNNGNPQTPHHIRSTSAMPNIRCSSTSSQERVFEVQSSSSSQNILNMAKTSLSQRLLTRRDSDLTHEKLRKQTEAKISGKRSSSYYLLKGFKDRMSNQFLKRNKSPSPERPKRQMFKTVASTGLFQSLASTTPTKSSPMRKSCGGSGTNTKETEMVFPSPRNDGILDVTAADIDFPQSPSTRPIVKARTRNTPSGSESKCGSIGSASSIRMSRSVHAKRGNTNSSKDVFNVSQTSLRTSPTLIHRPSDARSQKSSSGASTLTCRSSRKLSQSDQNSLKRRETSEEESTTTTITTTSTLKGSGDPPSPSSATIRKKQRMEAILKAKGVTRRNTVEGISNMRRRDGKIHIETQRRATCWNVATIVEDEKENQAKLKGDTEEEEEEEEPESLLMESFETNKSVLERMNHQSRMRRIGVHERRKLNAIGGGGRVSDSMTALNGSMAQFERSSPEVKKVQQLEEKEEVKWRERETKKDETQRREMIMEKTVLNRLMIGSATDETILSPKLVRGSRGEAAQQPPPTMTNYLMAATSSRPMSAIPLKKLDSIGSNGLAWVGERQLVVSSPQPPRRGGDEMRAVSATPEMRRCRTPTSIFRSSMRDLSSVVAAASPVMRRVEKTIISPLIMRSKSHIGEEKPPAPPLESFATPPRRRAPVASPQRPSNLVFSTPNMQRKAFSPVIAELSTSSRPKLKSTSSFVGSPRPPTPPSFVDLPMTPKMIRRQGLPLMMDEKSEEEGEEGEEGGVFKCPLLPPMRHRKTKSIDIGETTEKTKQAGGQRHQSASAVEGAGAGAGGKGEAREDESRCSESEFGFGEYNEALKNAQDELHLPTHKNVESRPSVALIRNSNCGLVQSRINQFQGLEKSRMSMDSTRTSAFSQASLKSVDSTTSSTDKNG